LDFLPGGVCIESALALIECHRDFFDDPHTSFEFSALIDIVEADSMLSAATRVKVGLADGSTRQVYLSLLYQRNQQDVWWPRLLHTRCLVRLVTRLARIKWFYILQCDIIVFLCILNQRVVYD